MFVFVKKYNSLYLQVLLLALLKQLKLELVKNIDTKVQQITSNIQVIHNKNSFR